METFEIDTLEDYNKVRQFLCYFEFGFSFLFNSFLDLLIWYLCCFVVLTQLVQIVFISIRGQFFGLNLQILLQHLPKKYFGTAKLFMQFNMSDILVTGQDETILRANLDNKFAFKTCWGW